MLRAVLTVLLSLGAPTALILGAPATALAQDTRRLLELPVIDADDLADLEARRLLWSRGQDRLTAEGDVRLEVGGFVLETPRLEVDLAQGRVFASGGVEATAGSRRLLARTLRLDLSGAGAEAAGAELTSVDPASGRRLVRLTAERLTRSRQGIYGAEQVRFTPCDCGPEAPPSWSLSAASARIDPEAGAWLFWPTFRVADVPVLPLPVFYVPLGERRSGLLQPEVGYSGRNGLRLAEPLYLVLGPSHDLTLTAGGWTGVEGPTGVKGFDQALEWRYAPSRRTYGRAELVHLYDLTEEGENRRGSRWAVRWNHAGRFDSGGFGNAGAGLHAQASLLGDAAWLSDLSPDLEGREVGYVRSAARLHAAPAPSVAVEVAGTWLQDLRLSRVTVDDVRVTRPLFGAADPQTGAPITFQPLPALHARLVPVPLAGGLVLQGDLHGVSWILPGADFDDAGPDGLLAGDLGRSGADPGEGDGLLGPGEQGPVLHARAAADLAQSFHAGDVLSGRLSAGMRLDGWRHAAAGGAEARAASRAYPLLSAQVHTGLSRRYGETLHLVRPSLSWSSAPVVWSEGARPDLDAFDDAITADGFHQVVAGVDSILERGGRRLAHLYLGQGFDLGAPALSESLARLDLALGRPLSLRGLVAVDPVRPAVTWAEASARGGASFVGAALRWTWLSQGGSRWLFAGLDESFAAEVPAATILSAMGRAVHSADLSLWARPVGPLTLRYGLRLDLAADAPWAGAQHVAGVAWQSACECWSGSVTAIWPPGQVVPEVLVAFSLAGLGG